ncbi:MAG TPA: pyridoxal 5'-phosphate synthase glutaminase subunit PdxT [Candidatus Eisenbacteria bacterium]
MTTVEKTRTPRVGVLAVQGDFAAHLAALERLGVPAVEVRTPAELSALDGVILPGGESGAHIRILKENGMWDALRAFHSSGGALWGTCAGLILLAKNVTNPPQDSLGLIDIDVVRNGWGRQIDSFEADVPFTDWGDIAAPAASEPAVLRLVFIRAPRISRVGPEARVLLSIEGEPIAVVQERVLVTTFHPEMTGDASIHRWFVERVVVAGGDSVSHSRSAT